MHYMWTSGRLLAMEDEEDGVAGLSQRMYLDVVTLITLLGEVNYV